MFSSAELFKARARLTLQEIVQGLSIHVPALRFLDSVDNLKGLICFGSNHHACE